MYELLEVAHIKMKKKKGKRKGYGSQLSQNHGQPPSRKKKGYNFKKAEKHLGMMY